MYVICIKARAMHIITYTEYYMEYIMHSIKYTNLDQGTLLGPAPSFLRLWRGSAGKGYRNCLYNIDIHIYTCIRIRYVYIECSDI